VIIVAFCLTDEHVTPQMIAVDEQNRLSQRLLSPSASDLVGIST